jgi:uncharacterized protein YchJ
MKFKRNDPCNCGSGKKFKKCCLLKIKQYEKEEIQRAKVLNGFCPCGSGKKFKKCCYNEEEGLKQTRKSLL